MINYNNLKFIYLIKLYEYLTNIRVERNLIKNNLQQLLIQLETNMSILKIFLN